YAELLRMGISLLRERRGGAAPSTPASALAPRLSLRFNFPMGFLDNLTDGYFPSVFFVNIYALRSPTEFAATKNVHRIFQINVLTNLIK
ncbi:MAG: hypothetical protein J5994_07800, partial [Ruminococcus sp.]|nr:hypothetical protein [Ruminococcus sp.]